MSDELLDLLINELKAPLTSGFINETLLRKVSKDNPNEISYLSQKIRNDFSAINTILNTVLLYKDIQKQSFTLKKEPVPLQEIFELNKELVSTAQKVRFITDISISATDCLLLDRILIKKAINVLFDNAVKFSQKDIIVSYKTKKNFFILAIQDFGIGMKPMQRKQLLNSAGQPSIPNTYPGLHVSVFIASQIIRKHGGILQIKSQFKKGTTCIVTLPLFSTK